MTDTPHSFRSHPAAVTADRLARHRQQYVSKLSPAEAQLLLDALLLLRQLAYHRRVTPTAKEG